MKISGYYLIGDQEWAGAVGDAMALFSIPPAGAVDGRNIGRSLAPEGIGIANRVTSEPKAALVTEVYFWRKPGVLGCLVKRTPSQSRGEAFAPAVNRLIRLHLLTLLKPLLGHSPGPWGILRGVRPTKIVHRLLDEGTAAAEIAGRMSELYAVEPAKAALITRVALRQRPVLPPKGVLGRKVGVYVGIPYCPTRCLYCSFPAYVLPADRRQVENFLAALQADADAAARTMDGLGLTAESVYIGGGTPTSLNEADFSRMLEFVRRRFVGPGTREFTVEAGRPDSITVEKLAAMVREGVTRISVNPQTMQEKTLKLIGRSHTPTDIIEIFGKIRQMGLPVINMDIIVGLPGEGEREIADTLGQIARLAPENLTVHTLAIKKGSLLKAGREELSLPGEELTARMLATAARSAEAMGLLPYYLYRQKYMTGNLENVGYAKPGYECIYNIQIMEERQTIIGVGPAAGTKAVRADFRLSSAYNPKDIDTYIRNLQTYVERRRLLLAELFSAEEENACL